MGSHAHCMQCNDATSHYTANGLPEDSRHNTEGGDAYQSRALFHLRTVLMQALDTIGGKMNTYMDDSTPWDAPHSLIKEKRITQSGFPLIRNLGDQSKHPDRPGVASFQR